MKKIEKDFFEQPKRPDRGPQFKEILDGLSTVDIMSLDGGPRNAQWHNLMAIVDYIKKQKGNRRKVAQSHIDWITDKKNIGEGPRPSNEKEKFEEIMKFCSEYFG